MKKSYLFCLFLFVGLSAKAQLLTTNGTAIVNESGDTIILRAMGLGGWMLQEGYMLQTAEFANAQHKLRQTIADLIGEASTNEFYDAWLNNHVTKADIDSMAAWGFNSVRLPMHYNLYTLPIELEPRSGENTWIDRGFEMTDQLIEWCKANDMYVILDLHAAPGGQGADEGISDYDPSKPSLWQSTANQAKTVALWRRLANRYKDEPWVAGYDLINEPNWNLPGGTLLRRVYEDITAAIREVDQEHIIFIEGNWFANDFTGLTPPWDDNMVYSPHKYWSFNEQSDISFATRLLGFNVPLFFGEAGENSNVWFRDAIKLFEDNGIGWAWWPEKKVESISNLMSITKSPEYDALLDFWQNGGTSPNINLAKATLLELAENTNIENCTIKRDVIDAIIRQPHTNETLPFKSHSLPGKIYAVDYDLGTEGYAYHDLDVANYHVSTGNFTAWNRGWSYRNDGVDIEPSEDPLNFSGHGVGFLDEGEWMQYELENAQPGIYDIVVRAASEVATGRFHFEMDGSPITEVAATPQTGGWQIWQNVTIRDIIIEEGDKMLQFHVDASGSNISSFEFIWKGNATNIAASFSSAFTTSESTIQLNLNKKMVDPQVDLTREFAIFVDGSSIPITNVSLDEANPRILNFDVNRQFIFTDNIRISYSGNLLSALDGAALETFNRELVVNNSPQQFNVPGLVQAEAFFNQNGIVLENSTDVGGGQNIGFLAPGDFCDYNIVVASAGLYNVTYRTASLNNGGSLRLQLRNANGTFTDLHNASFQSTGGWQDWVDSRNFSATLPAGEQVIRLFMTDSEFNINWFQFDLLADVDELTNDTGISVFPNPASESIFIKNENSIDIEAIELHDLTGKLLSRIVQPGNEINISSYQKGAYFLKIITQDGRIFSERIIKQ